MMSPVKIHLINTSDQSVILEGTFSHIDGIAWLNQGQLYPPAQYKSFIIDVPGAGSFPARIEVPNGLLQFVVLDQG